MQQISSKVKQKERVELIRTFKHFHSGAKVDIQLDTESPLRVKGKLVGFDEGNYIVLSLSPKIISDYYDLIKEGNDCIIRTLVEGEAGQCVAFRSSINIISSRPKGLVFIKFPQKVESISLRKESRMLAKLPVSIVHRDKNNDIAMFDEKKELTGHIKDISRGGCRVNVKWNETQGSIKNVPVYLKVTNSGQEQYIIVKASIKNQHRDDPASVSLGMMFEHNQKLDNLITELGL